MLVCCDDFQLPLDAIRLRSGGSAGGQKGLADILGRLGTTAVPRLRLGIGPVPPGWNPADFVLGRFVKAEQERVTAMVERAADAAEEWLARGIQAAMNRYN
jgi:PTH1 family peptidyl-tRNA hydrolase